MSTKDELLEHQDTVDAVRTFTEYFESKNNVTITKCELENNVVQSAGNFCSGILRLKYEYCKNGNVKLVVSDSVILKIPTLSMNYARIAKTSIYDNEICVYQHLLPKLYELWHGERFSPQFHTLTAARVLILEDLTAKGFRVRDKNDYLDAEHARVALTALARFHAVTVKYLQQLSRSQQAPPHSLIEPLKAADLEQDSVSMHERFLKLTATVVTPSIQQKLRNFKDKLVASNAHLINSDGDGLTVITHGDFWTTNILFGYDDEGRVKAAKMVDWQLSRRTSPIVDLIYCFVTGLRFETFRAHHEELLDAYVAALNETLSSLRCDCAYTRAQLDQDMQKYRYVFLDLLINAIPLAMLDREILFSELQLQRVPQRYLSFVSMWLTYLDDRDFL